MIIFTQSIFMDDNFSPRVKDVITYSKEEALRLVNGLPKMTPASQRNKPVGVTYISEFINAFVLGGPD